MGDFKNGKMHGSGKMVMPGDSIYEGDFECGEKSGRGKETYADTGCFYEGEFSINRKNGKGFFTFSDGSTYNGDFQVNLYIN